MMSMTGVPGQLREIFKEYVAGQAGPQAIKSARFKGRNVERYSRSAGGATAGQVVPLYKVQGQLRPLYGKGEPHPPSIGDHPDFEHLRGTDLEETCPVTTLFMDMEGSTRLNLLYSPSEVARIKNAFICIAIEVIKSFDGHVHRIMGDAVMAYFGGRNVRPEVAAIDGINSAALLQLLAQQTVIPYLEEQGFGDAFGIRVGLDHGSDPHVLWRSYGYPSMEEITATSFYVDVASKLQHAAGRNQIMIGNSVKELLDFPDDLLAVKTVTQRGEEVTQPFLLPNITDRQGNPIDYRQHLLRWEKYLQLSPIAPHILQAGAARTVIVSASLHSGRHGPYDGAYVPTGTLGGKGKALCFRIERLPFMPQLPYVVRFIVENHGREASQHREDRGNHQTPYDIRTQEQHRALTHWEDLAYRGLHYMTVEIRDGHGVRAKTMFGVYVE